MRTKTAPVIAGSAWVAASFPFSMVASAFKIASAIRDHLTRNQPPLRNRLEHRLQFLERSLDTDAMLGAQRIHFAVIDEAVGPADAHNRRLQSHLAQCL